MRIVSQQLSWTIVALLLTCSLTRGQDVDFERDILPILNQHCIECHGAESQESNLRLDSLEFALRGGDSGEAVIQPGNSAQSHFVERLITSNTQERMPLSAPPLSSDEISLLKKWIDTESIWKEARDKLAAKRPEHWSLQPVVRPSIPSEASGPSGLCSALDAFVLERLQKADLHFSERAGRRMLIRRLYFVMHGLPPRPDEVESFVSDAREDAWERLVDQVLASPRYGERMATMWLDLVRFGETNGFETNRERTTAYPYRDWVINAFNEDKAYDRFMKEQLAGDALGEPIGTGFLVAGPNDIVKGQDALLGLMQRQDELADIINATGTAFLGLTTGCARCHNHKFDPITQTDYYAMQAIFAGVEHADQDLPVSAENQRAAAKLTEQIEGLRSELSKLVRVAVLREPVNAVENIEQFSPIEARYVRFTIDATNASEPCIDELQVFAGDRNVALASAGAVAKSSGDFEHPLHKLEHLNDGQFGNPRSWIAKALSGGWASIEFAKPERIDRVVWGRDRNRQFADRVATSYRIEASIDGQQWKVIASSADRRPMSLNGKDVPVQYDLSGLSADEQSIAQAKIAMLQKLEQERTDLLKAPKAYAGRFTQPQPTQRLYRGDPTAPREVVQPGAIASLVNLELQNDAPEQQRRLKLANWIASRENPLSARVMVNRIWQFHFGVGLVDTPSDFGGNGTRPTHPELLDWLAMEFMDSGWSTKELHRKILNSRTWQQTSLPNEAGLASDAGTRLLWRFPARRLEAEAIRDCILATTDKLDRQIGGPGFSAFEVEFENVRHYFPKKDFGPSDWRRMIYMTKVRMEKDAVFGVFDCPDGTQVTPKRVRSTTPLQALNLLNSRFVLQQAEFLAERVQRERSTMAEQIHAAYAYCFGRPPDREEEHEAMTFAQQYGWPALARALLNANEFVFIP